MTASPAPTNNTLESWQDASLTGPYAAYANLTLIGDGWRSATGNAYDNLITGNTHPNYIDGGAGDDTLYGGGSIDHAAGHVVPRGDTFIIRAGEGNDTIMDFTPGVAGGDVISLPGFDIRSFDQVMQYAAQLTGGGVVFNFPNGQTLTVHHLTGDGTPDLVLSDFVAAGADFDYTARITSLTLQPDGQGGTVAVLSGTAEANGYVYIKDPAADGPDALSKTVTPSAQVDATGVWHYTTAPLAAGAHTFAVSSIQAAYSDTAQEWHYFQFSTSPAQTVTVGGTPPTDPTPTDPTPTDSTPPEAPTLLLGLLGGAAQVGRGVTTDSTPTLHGSAEAGSTITIHDLDGTAVLGTTTADATDGSWSLTTGGLATGAHHLAATATDAAGNVSAAAALDLTISPPHAAADFPVAGFDSAYYLSQNPDVAAAGADPLQHYLQSGWHEGRDPDALFDVTYYLNQNPDVAAAGVDPLQHYLQAGWHEGRDPSAAFSAAAYLAANPDVAAAGVNPLLHYLMSGEAEGRAAFAATPHASGAQDPLVDNAFYFHAYADVAIAGLDPSAHYAAQGWKEGRNPDAWFDTAYYLAHNQDVAAAGIDPLAHYEAFGWQEGRDPSAAFSSSAYLAANPDVAEAGIDPLLHYLQHGIAEHRDLGLG